MANMPKANLYQAALAWDGFVEMDGSLFVALATRQVSLFGLMKKWLVGQVRLSGIPKLIILWDLFRILNNTRTDKRGCHSSVSVR